MERYLKLEYCICVIIFNTRCTNTVGGYYYICIIFDSLKWKQLPNV